MKKNNKYFILSLILLNTSVLLAQETDTASIKAILLNYFPSGNLFVGSACHERFLGTETETILNREFSYVTPANEFKQTYIHSQPGVYQWDKSDTWIKQCSDNNQIMRLHAPISPQCSKWVKDDSRTPQELDMMLSEYMIALCTTYCNEPHVKWLDVVNETLNKDGTWFGPKIGTDKWENPWTIIGSDNSHEINPPVYIKKAFTLANNYAPNTKQIINQHGAFEDVVWEKMKKLVEYLRDNNLRVDGLGWQAHIDLGWELEEGNLKRLSAFIDWCHQNDLEFHITEFNVWLRSGDELKYEEQANTFYEIVKLLASKEKTGIVGINFWHIRGVETANSDRDGCPWDESYNPKIAYYKIKQALIDAAINTGNVEHELDEKGDIHFFPNPAKNYIRCSVPNNKIKKLTIINSTGKYQKFDIEGNMLNLQQLPVGVYTITVQMENNITTKRIIKM